MGGAFLYVNPTPLFDGQFWRRGVCGLTVGRFWFPLLALVVVGCGSVRPPSNDPAGLETALAGLATAVNREEAVQVARTACETSTQLAGDYRLVRPPFIHNCLVNLGLRKRGLCFHWAEDLTVALERLPWQTLELHQAMARIGRHNEHSAVVVTPRGGAFTRGIVLDGWRHSGRLYWGVVEEDQRYQWVPVEFTEPPTNSP